VTQPTHARPHPAHNPPPALIIACAAACGVMVANLYYAQPLIALIAPSLRLGEGFGGLIVTLTQLGYACGLLLIVPLADRMENKRLILITLGLAAAALVALAIAPSAGLFLIAAVVGCFSAGAQVIVPLAAALTQEARRGRTIGAVMSGLLAGIMLARPAASLVASVAGWRAVFWLSALLMLAIAAWLAKALPRRAPPKGASYGRMLGSMIHILRDEPTLQRRAVYQGLAFAVFNIFWTAAPLVLARTFAFDQKAIALFALAGAGGALAAPLAGRLGDRGHVRAGTAVALLTLTASALASGWAAAIGSVALLVVFAIALDAAVQVNQVLGQRVIYSLRREARGRINALYMTIVFVLGAGGSALATLAWHAAGWRGAMLAAGVIGAVDVALFATELWPDINARRTEHG
jgi:predicted MFS family arabinose efflux permease